MPIPYKKGRIIYKFDMPEWTFGVRFLDDNGKPDPKAKIDTKTDKKNPWNNKKSKKK